MAFVNMFNDRVEQFNLREENERLAELFSDESVILRQQIIHIYI